MAVPIGVKLCWGVLLVGFAVQIGLGYAIALGLDSALFAWHQDLVGEALWGSPQYGADAAAYRAWIQALLGGTLAAWAASMVFVVAVPLRRREPWAWWAIAVSTGLWFAVDTAVSARFGVWINVGFNLAALATIGLPLLGCVRWVFTRDA